MEFNSAASVNVPEKTETPEAATVAAKPTIAIKIASQTGGDVHFKIGPKTALGKLMKAYCDRACIAQNSVRFLLNGERLNPEDTPESSGLHEGDVIDAVLMQTGGAP